MEVRIKKLHPTAKLTVHEYGSGVDLFAHLDSPVLLCPGMRKLIPTGIQIQLMAGTEAHLRPKRSMAIDFGVTILDAPQIIREGENEEIHILLINLGEHGFSVKPGMAIAQMAIAPVYRPEICFLEDAEELLQDEVFETLREIVHPVNGHKMGALTVS